MKPGDFFIGVTDFFAVLVPGAMAAFLIAYADWPKEAVPARWPRPTTGSPEGWAIFAAASYLLGHVLFAAGGILDWLYYDRFYARWRRLKIRRSAGKNDKFLRKCAIAQKRLALVWRKVDSADGLLRAAKHLKAQHFQIFDRAGERRREATDAYHWAGTVVRSLPVVPSEVESLAAQSKLFRSLAVLLPFAAVWIGNWSSPWIVGWLPVWFFLVWRYARLRWDAVCRTYEYFIVACMNSAGDKRPWIAYRKVEAKRWPALRR